MKNFTLILLTLILLPAISFAQSLQLPRLFSDHMVLQREVPTRFWGWDEAGQEINIKIEEQSASTVTSSEGKWEAYFPTQQAGGPYTITITGSEEQQLEDVYFGDVWVAGGQSNMEWKLSWIVDGWEEEVAASNDYPLIRFFDVPSETSEKPEEQLFGGEWKIANSVNSPEFSALAWYFAKLNHTEKNVPVGIIESNWGGTPAESWTPLARLTEVPGYEEKAQELFNTNWAAEYVENEARWELKNDLVTDPRRGVEAGVPDPDFDDSNWQEVEVPTTDYLHGVVWMRRSFKLTETDITEASFIPAMYFRKWMCTSTGCLWDGRNGMVSPTLSR